MPRHGSMKNLDLKEWQRMARFIANIESSHRITKAESEKLTANSKISKAANFKSSITAIPKAHTEFQKLKLTVNS